MIKIGEKIAILRTCRGFSQEYMAAQIGIKQNTYSSYELHDEKISDDVLIKISQVLGVSVEDIKNPMPIFMSFHNNPNAVINGSNVIMPQEIVDEFFSLIKKKDEQIDNLLIQVNKLIEKLN
jgi:transcriptional regulator with XRE-family HTH domain